MEHYSENLLWGKGLYQKLRVVLIRQGERRFILFSTDLSLDPTDILSLYLRRSRVEGAFRELKQQIGAFSYRFWSKSMPRLKRFRKKTEPLPLESVTSRARILKTLRATELYALISSRKKRGQRLQAQHGKWVGQVTVGYRCPCPAHAVSDAKIAETLHTARGVKDFSVVDDTGLEKSFPCYA